MTEKLCNNWHKRIVDATSIGLVEVGKDDDVARLQSLIENGESQDQNGKPQDKLTTACEIAIAWIRFAQDLKWQTSSKPDYHTLDSFLEEELGEDAKFFKKDEQSPAKVTKHHFRNQCPPENS